MEGGLAGEMRFGRLFVRMLPVWCCLRLAAEPVKLIIDTDYDSDVDDVAALTLAHAYADAGEAEILGVAVVGLNATSAPAVHAQNVYYGRAGIPVGVRRGKGPPSSSAYTGMLVERFPAAFDKDAAPDAVALYRKLLAEADDQSVVIVSLGHLTNLADLLESGGDPHSPLAGKDLISKKVIRYVCMGTEYPSQLKPGKWGNFLPDPAAVIKVNNGWPTRIIYTGGGQFARQVRTGRAFVEDLPAGSLLHDAYEIFFEKEKWAKGPDHHSADLISIHIAVKGVTEHFRETKGGYCHVFANGTMEWRSEPDVEGRSYVADLANGVEGAAVAKVYNDLLLGAERKRLKRSQ